MIAGSANVDITENNKIGSNAQNSANGAQSSANNAYNYGIGVNEKVIEAQKDIQVARDATQAAVDGANKAVEEAGFSKTLADEAKKAAGQAASDALKAGSDATTAKADANTAKANATQAINDAATAKGQAASALGQANTAINNAANALDKFNNLAIGGRNYLADTSATWKMQGSGVTNQSSSMEWLFTFGTIKQAPFNDGDYVTVSFDYINVGTGAYGTILPQLNWRPWDTFNGGEDMTDNGHVVRTVQWQSDWQSDWNTNGTATGIRIRIDNVATTRTVTIYNMQFERGNKDTDWKQAPEDMATEVQFSQLQATVNGIQNKVASKADQSKVTHNVKSVPTADGAKITAE